MHSMAWVLWSSVLGCLLYLGATQTCSKIALKNAGNLLTNPTTIAEFQTAELTTCVRECMFRSGCKSVSYDRDLGVCQLTPLDSQVNATTFEANPRYKYTDMSEWPVVRQNPVINYPLYYLNSK